MTLVETKFMNHTCLQMKLAALRGSGGCRMVYGVGCRMRVYGVGCRMQNVGCRVQGVG